MKPQDPPEALGEGEGTEILGENAGSSFVGSSVSSALLCETWLCLPGSVDDEDSRRTTSKELVRGGAGAELPAPLDAARVSDTGTVLLPPLLVAITELGVLARRASRRRPPAAEVPAAEKGQSKMDLHTLSYTQNHRITEWQGLEGTSVGHLVQPPCPSRVTYSRLHRTLSRRVLISPEKETPQPPWAICSSAPSPSEGRSSSPCSAGTSSASVCAHCPLSCRWAPLKRAWPHPPDTHP